VLKEKYVTKKRVFNLVLGFAVLVSGCGGGSSSSSGDGLSTEGVGDGDNTENSVYSVSSYSSAATSESNLSGTWMYLEDSDLESVLSRSPVSSTRITGQTRSLVSVVDNGDGTITLVNCLRDGVNQQTVSVVSDALSVDRGTFDFAGSVINKRLIEGELYSSNPDHEVKSSVVTLVKIADGRAYPGGGVSIGNFDLTLTNYDNNSFSGSLVEQPIHCFKQSHYDVTITDGGSVGTDTRSTVYIASIDESEVLAATANERWLNAYFVEMYVSDDLSKNDANLQFSPPSSSNMSAYRQTGSISIEIEQSDVSLLSGTAENSAYNGDSKDIGIEFEIAF
jgi:hypothetical protein